MLLLGQVHDVGFVHGPVFCRRQQQLALCANIGPFKVISELVRFQRLWTFSIDVRDGKLC